MDSFHAGSPSYAVSDAEDSNSDGEMDWEEVVVPVNDVPPAPTDDSPSGQEKVDEAPQGPSETEGIEITIKSAPKVDPQRK